MRVPNSGMRIDDPSAPLLMAQISYWDTTDNDGNVGGTTLRCGGLANEPSYANHAIKVLSGDAAGQIRDITTHPAGTDTVTVSTAFTDNTGAVVQIVAGTVFVILSIAPADAEVTEIRASQLRSLFSMEFWSLPQEEVAIPAAPADQALPDVTVADLPAGATIVRAIAMFVFRVCEDSSAAGNALAGAQEIQVRDDTPSAWIDAINFVDNQFTLAASAREGGTVVVGAIDISGTVDGNDTYNFQWDEAVADAASLLFNDVQVGIKIWYSV